MHKQSYLTLLQENRGKDAIGQEITEGYSETLVPCLYRSASQTEQQEAYRRGFDAECRCEVFFLDYSGESLCEWQSKRYEIYRTYEVDDRIELYLGTRIGEDQ